MKKKEHVRSNFILHRNFTLFVLFVFRDNVISIKTTVLSAGNGYQQFELQHSLRPWQYGAYDTTWSVLENL